MRTVAVGRRIRVPRGIRAGPVLGPRLAMVAILVGGLSPGLAALLALVATTPVGRAAPEGPAVRASLPGLTAPVARRLALAPVLVGLRRAHAQIAASALICAEDVGTTAMLGRCPGDLAERTG